MKKILKNNYCRFCKRGPPESIFIFILFHSLLKDSQLTESSDKIGQLLANPKSGKPQSNHRPKKAT